MQDTPLPPTGPIVVPVDQKPTLANGGAVNGAIIGSLAGSNNLGGAIAGSVIGGLIGGELTKNAMERDYMQGRVVRPPNSLDYDIGISILTGGVLALALGAIATVGPLALIALGVGGVLLGGILGFMNHQNRVRDYENAQDYYVRHGGGYEGREREMQKAYQVSAEESRLLAERLAAGQNRTHAEQALSPPRAPATQR